MKCGRASFIPPASTANAAPFLPTTLQTQTMPEQQSVSAAGGALCSCCRRSPRCIHCNIMYKFRNILNSTIIMVILVDKVSQAVESLQLSEVSQVNSILLDQKLHQQILDQEIEKAIGLHQRLFTRSKAVEVRRSRLSLFRCKLFHDTTQLHPCICMFSHLDERSRPLCRH